MSLSPLDQACLAPTVGAVFAEDGESFEVVRATPVPAFPGSTGTRFAIVLRGECRGRVRWHVRAPLPVTVRSTRKDALADAERYARREQKRLGAAAEVAS